MRAPDKYETADLKDEIGDIAAHVLSSVTVITFARGPRDWVRARMAWRLAQAAALYAADDAMRLGVDAFAP